jgi:pimeloyl-ACP methyl ester carboxylesterase
VNGTTLHAEVRGAGPAILLIPGGAEDAEGWRPVAERLSGCTVVTYDRRGTLRCGREDWPGGGSAQHADDAAGLLLELGLGDVVVFGGSSAGIIAMQVAILHPALLQRALVCEPGYLRCALGGDELRSRVASAVDAYLARHPRDWPGAYRAFARAASSAPGSESHDLLAAPPGKEWHRQREELNAEAFVRDDVPILTAEVPDEASLASSPVDIRFSHGSETGAVFKDISLHLAAVRGATPDIIDGVGHALYLHPDAAADYLRGHVET